MCRSLYCTKHIAQCTVEEMGLGLCMSRVWCGCEFGCWAHAGVCRCVCGAICVKALQGSTFEEPLCFAATVRVCLWTWVGSLWSALVTVHLRSYPATWRGKVANQGATYCWTQWDVGKIDIRRDKAM